MRLLFLLPALFMALVMQAQPNCQITDLVTTITATDPANCKFSVQLDFKHDGTTNQFTVQGNGTNYGTFTYNQLPVTLGPIMGQANAPTVRELIVHDVVLDCKAETVVTLPACSASGQCKIRELSAVPGDCIPGTNSFPLKINFAVDNPGDLLFEAWTVGGTYLGIFPIAQLPLTLPAFPAAAGGAIKVCINDQPDCCAVAQFVAPTCTGNCGIFDLSVETGDCTSDTTFKVKVNFAHNLPVPGGLFTLAANGTVIGTFNLNQLPLSIPNFPWNGHAFNTLQVCLLNSAGIIPCCLEKEFLAPKCVKYQGCEMSRIKLETGDCTSDSTFKVTINFLVADTAVVDSFMVWADGNLLGTYGLNQLPLMIPNYPWKKGTIFSTIRICTGNSPLCCRERQFLVPKCLPFGDCKVEEIKVLVGHCNLSGTFNAIVNFQATNPGNGTFTIAGNGQVLGTFPLGAVPVTIPNFPSNGAAIDVIRICVNNADPNTPPCCESKEFEGPDCLNHPCGIVELSVLADGCTSDSTFKVKINFDVIGSQSNTFTVAGNGQNLGTFNLSQLPLVLTNFPSNGTATDVIKICLIGSDPSQAPCCILKEFQGPACNNQPCEIYGLKVEAGPCTSDSTYKLVVNFQVQNPGGTQFGLWGNGIFIGNYNLNQLPLTLPNFNWNGGANDVVKVCMITSAGTATCCRTLEFPVPGCFNHPCGIVELSVLADGCTSDSTFKVKINFDVIGSQSNTFTVAGNGQNLGTFNLSQLPLVLTNFPSNGTATDVIKICLIGSDPSQAPCCILKEFQGPACNNQPCEIYGLKVEVGPCTSDSTYKLVVNFQVSAPMTGLFSVVANGQFFGFFNLSQLPLMIDFPWNGGANDVVKVCVVAQPGVECCKTLEFKVPDCLTNPVCEVYDLTVITGDCTSDSTYNVKIDFEVTGNTSSTFGVWGNNVFIGNYNLSQLPLTIPNFLWNGGSNDVIKVCIITPNAPTSCCKTKEFAVPACLHDCDIHDFQFSAGDCTSDSTYKIKLNFKVSNLTAGIFGIWANGQNIGYYNLNQLPLSLSNFPSNGGANDVIKVCLIGNNIGTVLCCYSQEFPVPDCIDVNCHIWDLKVIKTPCLCGQFFAVLTFQHENGDAGGFDIVGNGQNYGNYPYNHPQPIILGPLVGDGTKSYEFVVKDHLLGDCKDVHELGKVECATPTDELLGNGGSLAVSPNPATDRLSVAARLDGITFIGQAQVDIRHADGRLVQTLTVTDGGNFQLDVSVLPAGVYRITLMTEQGRLETSFVKQ